jgi:hypothetical protein
LGCGRSFQELSAATASILDEFIDVIRIEVQQIKGGDRMSKRLASVDKERLPRCQEQSTIGLLALKIREVVEKLSDELIRHLVKAVKNVKQRRCWVR